MSFIRWDDRYLTHISKFDEQHQHLFKLINELHNGVLACSTLEEEKEITKRTLAELVTYAQEHFGAEEDLMQTYSYPQFGEHQNEHEQFCLRVSELVHDYITNPAGLSLDVFLFLRDWITKHVTETDIHYVSFFKEQGVE